jgi:ATP-dependent Lon protease
MFIATANLLDPIQPAFLDRMEVLRLTGYTEAEKLAIAERHLIPKQLEANGVTTDHVVFHREGVARIIADYTKEAGLRNLERELASICRKVAVRVARGETRGAEGSGGLPVHVGPEVAAELLGPARHHAEELLNRDRVGVATGLAWTAAGGDLMFIEVTAVPGKGKLALTGQLGEVMRESAQAAHSYARAYAARHEAARGDGRRFFAEHDVHVHVPAGSIPKDGPSAGITIATAILSVLLAIPVDRRVAMTGEITLRGDVMPIGGLKEKVMAAKLAGVVRVLVPALNRRDLVEVPEAVKEGLDIRFVEHMDDVLAAALTTPPPAAHPAEPAAAAHPAAGD